MCCLEYENEHYSETFKRMPKVGSEVITPEGKATVISNNMLKLLVKVKIESGDGSLVFKDFKLCDVKVKKANKIEEVEDDANSKEIADLLD